MRSNIYHVCFKDPNLTKPIPEGERVETNKTDRVHDWSDRHFGHALITKCIWQDEYRIVQIINECFKINIMRRSGGSFMQAGDFMDWHTNSNSPGWRLYITYAEEPHKSSFFYKDGEEVVETKDTGWDARLFLITAPEEGLFWHRIESHTNRFSLGFNLGMDIDPSLLSVFVAKLCEKSA